MISKKKNRLELLDTDLLNSKKDFDFLYYWLGVFRTGVGWHYPLDLVWINQKIDALDIPKGSTVLDAGGGVGMLQFLMAAKGYNVISVDFANRTIPKLQSLVFKIEKMNIDKFENEYTTHLNRLKRVKANKNIIATAIKTIKILNLGLIKETLYKKHGKIFWYQANFKEMPLIKSESIDAIVSVSAIEHNPNIEDLKKATSEFERVLKKNAPILITTSATDKETWFHEPSKGWCFSEKTLKDIYNLNNYESNYGNYENFLEKIKNSQFLRNNLPDYSYKTANCGLPFGIWDPKYIPVGVEKWKK